MELGVEYHSLGPEEEEGTGTTENVSAGGVYFVGSNGQQLKEGVRLRLRLSGIDDYTVGSTFESLSGKCTVLRVEPESDQLGVAVQFDEVFKLEAAAARAS